MENGFQKVIRNVRGHWEALVCAVAFAVLLVTPFVVQRLGLGSQFQGIEPEFANDESLYMSGIRDVLDGHPSVGNAYLAEHKDKPPQQLFVSQIVLAQLTRLSGLEVAQARILIGAFLGLITFLAAYAVSYRILGSRMAGLVVAVFMLFGWYGNLMNRPISPQFIFIFWWLAIGALWELNRPDASRKQMVYAGGILGVLFYIYPYYWTWMVLFMALMVAGLWFVDRQKTFRWIGALMIGCIIGSGSLIMSLQASRLSEYSETMTRLGMITTRFPSGFEVVLVSGLGLLASAWLLYRRRIAQDRTMLFWIVALATSIVAVNQHLITGKNFEFSSHYDTQAVSIAVLLAFFLLRLYPWRRLIYAWVLVIALVNVWNSFYGLFSVSETTAYRQEYAPVFAWLNHNAPADSVVYANSDLSYWIPVYTPHNVFSSRNAGFFLVSDAELERRFLAQHYFDPVDYGLVLEQERALVGVRYIDQRGHIQQRNKLRRFLGLQEMSEPAMPASDVDRIVREAATMKARSFEQALRPFESHYFVWDAVANPDWKLQEQSWLTPVFRHKQFVIFARKSQLAQS